MAYHLFLWILGIEAPGMLFLGSSEVRYLFLKPSLDVSPEKKALNIWDWYLHIFVGFSVGWPLSFGVVGDESPIG